MPKQNQIDKAVAALQSEIDVLQLAITKLRAQQQKASAPKRASKKPPQPVEAKTA